MEKTIAIVMGASVLLIASLTVAFMGADSVLGIGGSADDVSTNQNCEFQEQKIKDDEMDPADADDSCNFDTEVEEEILGDELGPELLP